MTASLAGAGATHAYRDGDGRGGAVTFVSDADAPVLVVPGSFPKTASGKVQRSRCRDQCLSPQPRPS